MPRRPEVGAASAVRPGTQARQHRPYRSTRRSGHRARDGEKREVLNGDVISLLACGTRAPLIRCSPAGSLSPDAARRDDSADLDAPLLILRLPAETPEPTRTDRLPPGGSTEGGDARGQRVKRRTPSNGLARDETVDRCPSRSGNYAGAQPRSLENNDSGPRCRGLRPEANRPKTGGCAGPPRSGSSPRSPFRSAPAPGAARMVIEHCLTGWWPEILTTHDCWSPSSSPTASSTATSSPGTRCS